MKVIKALMIPFCLGMGISVYAEDFVKNGSVNLTQTFYGNAGSYKTKTAHPAMVVNYNFSPQWNVQFEWNRTWNMFNYNGSANQQDNSYSAPEFTLTNNYGQLGDSKVNWSSSFLAKYENSFDETDQTFLLAQTGFDISKYFPRKKYFDVAQFAITPMYYYGWNTSGVSGHNNTAVISLLTDTNITSDLSLTFNAYALRSWGHGNSFTTNSNDKNESANYFMVISYLDYSKDIYQFNTQLSLDFNFIAGFDPWISSNKDTTVEPFLVSNQMYEWMSPTVLDGTYKNTFTFFTLPQLQLTYDFSKETSFNFFIQSKYSNQRWGDNQKGWSFQPQGGFGLTHNF